LDAAETDNRIISVYIDHAYAFKHRLLLNRRELLKVRLEEPVYLMQVAEVGEYVRKKMGYEISEC
jgi:hypothetical protein